MTPNYTQIISIVNDCVERMKRTGESHLMFAKWVSEGINSAQSTPAGSAVSWGDSGPIPGQHFGDEFDAAPPQAGTVKVKPLEWREDEENWHSAVPQLPQCYEVRTTLRGQVRSRWGRDPFEDFDGTVEQAKAAAQHDFETRIMSMLVGAK